MRDSPVQAALLGTGIGLLGYGILKGVTGFWGWTQDGQLSSISNRVAQVCYNWRPPRPPVPGCGCSVPNPPNPY